MLAATHLHETSHLANEALNETIVQNPILLVVYRHISARDQTVDRDKDTGRDVGVAISQTAEENSKRQSEVGNETLWVSAIKMGGLLNCNIMKNPKQ